MRNIHPYHKISTPGVIISNHKIFTHLHRGEYIMASNFHLFTWRQNIIVSNISPPPLGENFIVSNIYSSPGVRILYHKILTLLWNENIISSHIHSFTWGDNIIISNIHPFCLMMMMIKSIGCSSAGFALSGKKNTHTKKQPQPQPQP